MVYYPVFLDLRDRPCLVIGGGAVGRDKAEGLLAAGARVTVISPTLAPALAQSVAQGRLAHIARAYQEGDLAPFDLVMIATDDRGANAAIRAEGRRRRLWVNAADDPANCDFILPSVLRRGDVAIAISTGGGSPALARRLREELSAYLDEDIAGLADLLAEVRRDLKARALLPRIGQEEWQRAIDGRLRALLAQRRWGQAKALLLARLGVPVVAGQPPSTPPALRQPQNQPVSAGSAP